MAWAEMHTMTIRPCHQHGFLDQRASWRLLCAHRRAGVCGHEERCAASSCHLAPWWVMAVTSAWVQCLQHWQRCTVGSHLMA
jgi:hypothetical protein